MAFELYTKTRAASDEENVSITATGVITLSAACTKKHFVGIEYVQLYYDPTAKRVGIKPLKKAEKYSYKVVRPANSKRVVFSGRGFLRMYHISEGEKGKFNPQTFDTKFEDGMITFSVK